MNTGPDLPPAANALRAARLDVAERVTTRQFDANPAWEKRYGPLGRVKCVQDTLYHLDYLIEALAYDAPALFSAYLAWAGPMLNARGISTAHLDANLDLLADVMDEVLPRSEAQHVRRMMDTGRATPEHPSPDTYSFLDDSAQPDLAHDYLDALLDVDRSRAERLVLDAVEAGMHVSDVYLHVFQPVQHEVGRLWQLNRISVAQEHFCTAATQQVMSRLYRRVFETERNGHSIVITCVGDELHEIGARMVSDFFELAGWDAVYLGANTPPGDVVDMVRATEPDVLGLSVTLTPHVARARDIIRALRAEPTLAHVKVLVGGYPFNIAPGLAANVGADGHAASAHEAPNVAERLFAATG